LLPVYTANSTVEKGHVQICFPHLLILAINKDLSLLESTNRLPFPSIYLRTLNPQDWTTGLPFEKCVGEAVVLKEIGTLLTQNCTYSQLFPFLQNTYFAHVIPTPLKKRHLFPRFSSKASVSNLEEKLDQFFNTDTTTVIEVHPSLKSSVLKRIENGVIYTSKQTSAGDIYQFENELYISFQVKCGKTRAFGPAAFKTEVEKAILHNTTENYNFVLVFVVERLASFFDSPERQNEQNCATIINNEKKPLAIQFFPGYEMSIKRKRKVIINETPSKKKKTQTTTERKEKWVSYIETWRIPESVQTVLLFEEGFRVLLGEPIKNFIFSGNVMDKALAHSLNLPLPDPVLLNQPQFLIDIAPQNEDEVMVDVNNE